MTLPQRPRANDTGTSALRHHIALQQTEAIKLCGVLQALASLNNDGVAANAQTTLIDVALAMASDLNNGLDSVTRPDDGAVM